MASAGQAAPPLMAVPQEVAPPSLPALSGWRAAEQSPLHGAAPANTGRGPPRISYRSSSSSAGFGSRYDQNPKELGTCARKQLSTDGTKLPWFPESVRERPCPQRQL